MGLKSTFQGKISYIHDGFMGFFTYIVGGNKNPRWWRYDIYLHGLSFKWAISHGDHGDFTAIWIVNWDIKTPPRYQLCFFFLVEFHSSHCRYIYGGFHKWGYTIHHPFLDGIFPDKNHRFGGTSIDGNPHIHQKSNNYVLTSYSLTLRITNFWWKRIFQALSGIPYLAGSMLLEVTKSGTNDAFRFGRFVCFRPYWEHALRWRTWDMILIDIGYNGDTIRNITEQVDEFVFLPGMEAYRNIAF